MSRVVVAWKPFEAKQRTAEVSRLRATSGELVRPQVRGLVVELGEALEVLRW